LSEIRRLLPVALFSIGIAAGLPAPSLAPRALLAAGAAAIAMAASARGSSHRFRRALGAQGFNKRRLPYVAPLQPYSAWYGLFFNLLIIFNQLHRLYRQ